MTAYDPSELIKLVKQMSDTEKAQLLGAMELSHPLLPAHADPRTNRSLRASLSRKGSP